MSKPLPQHSPEVDRQIEAIRAQTPARILVGRSGAAYRTSTQLALRADHAIARDAVHDEIDLPTDLGPDRLENVSLFEVQTCARNKQEYLLRPDSGRQLSPSAREMILARCPREVDLQIVVGDGLSAAAVRAQVPTLLPQLTDLARLEAWSVGVPFFVRYCRVGVMNDIGDLLQPEVVVLLIGERPGLATAESLSAYMAYRPCAGDTDAKRNLISNIHVRGIPTDEAARRILALVALMREVRRSGVEVKEHVPIPLPEVQGLNEA